MLTVACYLWTDPKWKHAGTHVYGPAHVRLLKAGVKKHLKQEHQFACITDDLTAFVDDPEIRVIPIDQATHIPGTEFVKLMTFHPYGPHLIGERVLQLDLDSVIVGELDPLVNRPEPLVVWRNPARVPWDNPAKYQGRALYNGSVILHTCGTIPQIWTGFLAHEGPLCRDTQVWMSALIGPEAPYWDSKDGIYRLARADTPGSGIAGDLPSNARIVTFPGDNGKPWLPHLREANPWLKDHWPDGLH